MWIYTWRDVPGGSAVKNPPIRHKRCGFHPWVRKIPWRRAWEPNPVFLSEESHGQRSLVGYSPWGCKESDMIEETEHARLTRSFWLVECVPMRTLWHTHEVCVPGCPQNLGLFYVLTVSTVWALTEGLAWRTWWFCMGPRPPPGTSHGTTQLGHRPCMALR